MKARFIGVDGSLGLRNGVIYDIKIENPSNENILVSGWRGIFDSQFYCPYDNINGFLRNWRPLVFDRINGSFVYDK